MLFSLKIPQTSEIAFYFIWRKVILIQTLLHVYDYCLKEKLEMSTTDLVKFEILSLQALLLN